MGRDGWTGLVILVASLGFLWATLGLETHPMVPVGPGFYPRIVLGITAAMALALMVADVLARRRARKTPTQADPEGGGRARPNYGLVVGAFAIFGVYVLLLPGLGFRLATFAFMVGMQAALEPPRGAKAWMLVIVVALATTLAAYFAFERYLHVLLPRGRWTGF